jgi:hypothetical protein
MSRAAPARLTGSIHLESRPWTPACGARGSFGVTGRRELVTCAACLAMPRPVG